MARLASFPASNEPFFLLRKGEVSGRRSHCPQRFDAGDLSPRAVYPAAPVLPRHGDLHLQKRIEGIHRVIRIEADHVIAADRGGDSTMDPVADADQPLGPAAAVDFGDRLRVLVVKIGLRVDTNPQPPARSTASGVGK